MDNNYISEIFTRSSNMRYMIRLYIWYVTVIPNVFNMYIYMYMKRV